MVDSRRSERRVGAARLPGRAWARGADGRVSPRLLRWLLGAALCAVLVVSLAWDLVRVNEAAARFGPVAQAGARQLSELITSGNGWDDEAKLSAINVFFNRRIVFRDDLQVWGVPDYWASPLETLAKGAGDCEDYAIAKYFSLLAMGVTPGKLRLVYVRAVLGGPGGPSQAHMVLTYQANSGSEPLVLDNLITDIRPASRRPDLTPVFSFNADGLWQGTGGVTAGDPTARLSRWREVLTKAREQGFY